MGVCQIRTKAGAVLLKSVDRSILIGIDIAAMIGLIEQISILRTT
jgi:hypothetical protein